MRSIKVLDCTLREGGYINNWNFGCDNIKNIIKNLQHSNIDFIECGYLKPVEYSSNRTLFNSLSDFSNVGKNLTLMINYGEYDIKNINSPHKIRIAFKKHQFLEALQYCKDLKNHNIFINPMHTNTYSKEELSELIRYTNEIQPIALTITDSTGSMKEDDLKNILNITNNNLDGNISLCFHSHNNLGLSFSNTKFLIENCKNRDIIIDSTLSGIGRGAGNLPTEVITEYLNKNCDKNYNIEKLIELNAKEINPINEKSPKKYSIPYYLSGLHNCHPNYAKYLIDKSLSYEKIDEVLKKIPTNKKSCYDENIIKQFI